jgi:hypothetical protein
MTTYPGKPKVVPHPRGERERPTESMLPPFFWRNVQRQVLIQDYVVRVAPSLRVAHHAATTLTSAPEGDAGRSIVVGNPDLR